MSTEPVRRPIDARNTGWAKAVARFLTAAGCTPNQISIASVACAALAGGALVLAGQGPAWRLLYLLGAAAGIQLRLLCNLFDGMVAVEGGKKTKSGEVFNDFPDRLSDPLILIGAGYSIPLPHAIELGWAAALLAVMTAYVRVLGGSIGTPQFFLGPMAKQHRMAVMTAACVLSIGEVLFLDSYGRVLMVALSIVALGSAFTCWRRALRIVETLENRPD